MRGIVTLRTGAMRAFLARSPVTFERDCLKFIFKCIDYPVWLTSAHHQRRSRSRQRRLVHALGCATKGTENQWVQVPPEHVSVQLGSYPGSEGGQPF